MILQTGNRQDNVTSTQNMHHRIPITNLNGHLTCSLCKGYFVDATTIIECLHSFCRSCIVKYLQTNKYCPVCDVQVHKTKPLLNIRPDKTLQDIVYKLVPRLFQNEMQRRRQYYSDNPDVKPSGLEQCGEASYQHLLTPDESICISFNYHGNSRTRRYLRCPAAVSVSHLQKLIRAKYDLKDNHRVDILYNQDCLNSYLTLMDIAYIYLWRRKGPMEITYRIYENTAKRVKVQEDASEEGAGVVLNNNNNSINHNDWKEVQLRISENGEMSVTGIQDCLDMLDEHIEAIDETSRVSSEGQTCSNGGGAAAASEVVAPGEGVGSETSSSSSSVVGLIVVAEETSKKKEKKRKNKVQQRVECGAVAHSKQQVEVVTNCSTKEIGDGCNNNNNGSKRKLVEVIGETGEPPTKKSKSLPAPPTTSTASNQSVGLQNLSNNHPLKKHSLSKVDGGTKSNKVNSDMKKEVTVSTAVVTATTTTATTLAACTASVTVTATAGSVVAASTSEVERKKEEKKVSKATEKEQQQSASSISKAVISTSSIATTTVTSSSTFTRPSNVNTTTSKQTTMNNTRPVSTLTTLTTITTSTPTTTPPGQKWGKASTPGPPSYIPKPAYSPIINVPKVQPSTSSVKQLHPPQEINTTQSSMMSKTNSSAVTPKSKPNSPMGYKTLRDPPKTWNPQIARPKPSASAEPSKNVRPAKFFKVRNNIPRYLGNPASGVKPLYQVQHNVEKEKPRPEIKRHSIVKIDPKTLKPVSERAPESSNLTNITVSQPDLKISTSSVPIFNPLKLQSSPKSADRKSPQSPKKSPTTTTMNKRDKLNLSYTPPNPFIPNISPTLNPQFLYPSGPPGFPSYDPRYMAAYHSLFFGSRPAPYNPSTTTTTSLPSPHSTGVGGLNLEMSSPQRANSPKNSTAKPKKTKEEKSLQNAVEKLTKIKSEETKAAKKEERKASSCKEEDVETRKKKQTTPTTVDSAKQVEIKQKSESNVDISNQNNNTIAAVDNGDNKSDNNIEKKSKK